MQFNCVKKLHKNGTECSLAQHRFPIRSVSFLSVLCFFLCVWLWWIKTSELRKLWDSLSELRSSLCERRLERTVLRSALLPVKTSQFTQFSHQVWRHTVKSLSLTESVERPWRSAIVNMQKTGHSAIYRLCRVLENKGIEEVELKFCWFLFIYKVVQIWPGLFTLVYIQISPGHIWTTL